MILTGYARRIERSISPATILAAEYAESHDPAVLAAHCLAAVDPTLAERTREGDILVVAGEVQHGPHAETAVLALQALGIAAVVCRAADAEMIALAGAAGLPLLVQVEATTISEGRVVRLDLARGTVQDQFTGQVWQATPCTAETLAATQRTQLLARMRRVVDDEGLAE